MKLATIAFFISLVLAIALATAGMLGYDPRTLGVLVGGDSEVEFAPVVTPEETQKEAPPVVPVPSGSFKGPTGKPTVVGPKGPPPNE